jgi:hypothetical protein
MKGSEESAVPTRILGYVILTLRFEREGNKWVGTCLELGTSTFHRTLKRCEEELRELVVEHLNALEEAGERERFFQKWGIAFHHGRTTPHEVTIRGSGEDWNRLFEGTAAPYGPFFQPSRFPVRTPERQLAGV